MELVLTVSVMLRMRLYWQTASEINSDYFTVGLARTGVHSTPLELLTALETVQTYSITNTEIESDCRCFLRTD